MPVELRHLRCFLAVAEHHSIQRGATALALTKSTVSAAVRDLEEQLGVSLFERHRAGVRLTVAGERFFEDIRVVLSCLDGAIRTVQVAGHGGNGVLKIGVVASISSGHLNELLRSYRSAHPAVQIKFVEGDHHSHVADIVGRNLDLGILTGTLAAPPGCDAEVLWHEPIFVAMPASHPHAEADILGWSDLADDVFLVSSMAPGPEIHDFLVKRLAQIGFSPTIQQQRVAREGLMALVDLGFGLALMSGAESRSAHLDVRFVPLDGEVLPFSAVWSPDNDNPALRRFLSLARTMARKEKSSASVAPTQSPGPTP